MRSASGMFSSTASIVALVSFLPFTVAKLSPVAGSSPGSAVSTFGVVVVFLSLQAVHRKSPARKKENDARTEAPLKKLFYFPCSNSFEIYRYSIQRSNLENY